MLPVPSTIVFALCCTILIEACGQTRRSSMQGGGGRLTPQQRRNVQAEQTRQIAGRASADLLQRERAQNAQTLLSLFQQSRIQSLQLSNPMVSAAPVTSMPMATAMPMGRKKRHAALRRRRALFKRS
ncbi:hypothetical protein GCK32_019993 [Trichostrongylus colubriformis]|uniref:Secreted protein n=1 Tax=Trichostrongylus colubriformis TaxID=6319 RepID=A0AAN8FB51_TRICO